jgi:hypothetical protein
VDNQRDDRLSIRSARPAPPGRIGRAAIVIGSAILLVGLLLTPAQLLLAWDVTNTYTNQGGGDKDCGAPPPGVWTEVSSDNAGYPCGESAEGVYLCECDAMNAACSMPALDYWSYIVHGSMTFGTQIELRASESCADSGSCANGGPSITLSQPTQVNGISEAVQPNDVMITQLAAYTSGQPLQPPTPPAGSTWTEIANSGSSAEDEEEWAFYHIAGSSEPATYTWTFNTNVEAAVGGIAAYAGVSTTSPIASSSAVFAFNSTTIACPAVSAGTNQQALCLMATFAGVPTNWNVMPNLSAPGLFLGERWLLEFPQSPPDQIDAAFIDQPIKQNTPEYTVTANIPQSADNGGISVLLSPAAGPPTVSTVEVRTYVGGGGGVCTGGSTVTCDPGHPLVEDSTYPMPTANSINVPFDAAEFNLPSHYSTVGDENFQVFYVFAKPTGGSVSCADIYITHETN